MLLAGDIGGTKTRLAIYESASTLRKPLVDNTFPSGNYDSLEAVIEAFLEDKAYDVERASFGVAGPVVAGRAQITNLPWVIEESRIRQALGLDSAVLLNDLGLCYARAGQSQNAIAVQQRAVEMSPSSTLYRNNLAAALVEADRSGEAVPLLAQTCGTAVAHYNVGYLLHKRGANGAAVEHFVASLEANPSLTPARSMLQQLAPQMSQLPIRIA